MAVSVARGAPAGAGRGRSAARPVPSAGNLVVATLVAVAAAVHSILTPEHFEEGVHFGLFFLGASAFQWWVAFALLLRPGAFVYRAGLWGSAALVATWMATRLVPPPGAAAPEPVEFWGVFASSLEIAAIVALASMLPAVGPVPGALKRRTLAAAAGLGFALLVVVASGAVVPIPPGEWSGPSFLFRPFSVGLWRLEGIWLVVAGRWSAIVPWLTIAFVVLGGLLVAWTVSLALRLPQAGRRSARRRGVFAALPGFATVPVCCGAPLAGFAGGVAVGTLFRWTPWLMAASLVLLGGNALLLRRTLRSRPAPSIQPSRSVT